MIVAADDVSKRGESLFYSLDLDAVGDRVAEVLEFLVGGSGGNEETFLVAGGGLVRARDEAGGRADPAVKRPTIRVPAMVAWQMGMTSWSSASKTLSRACQ